MPNTKIYTIFAAASLVLAASAPPSATAAPPPPQTIKTLVSVPQTAAMNKVLEGTLDGSYAGQLRYRVEVVNKLESLVEAGVLVPVDVNSTEPPEERQYTIAGGGKVFGIEIAWFRPSIDVNEGPTIHTEIPLDSVLEKLSGHVPTLTRVKMSPGREQSYSASTGIFPRKGAKAVGTVLLVLYTFDAGASVNISSNVIFNESLQNYIR